MDLLIRALQVHERKYRAADDRAEYYYTIRGKKLTCSLGGAANLIFLNKTCFNGLYRVNSKNEFNVPHGKYQHPTICPKDTLRAASSALKDVQLQVSDFAEAPANARAGDFVYFDPPYIPLSNTANFTSYTKADFTQQDQQRLAQTAETLANQGAAIALSNSAHPDVTTLYQSATFQLQEVQARRAINSKASGRGPTREYLIQSVGSSPPKSFPFSNISA